MKITKKFYVGSRTMNPNSSDGRRYQEWAKKTLQEAIDHAKSLAEETEEDQIVVQIVRIVRKQKTPLIVEKV